MWYRLFQLISLTGGLRFIYLPRRAQFYIFLFWNFLFRPTKWWASLRTKTAKQTRKCSITGGQLKTLMDALSIWIGILTNRVATWLPVPSPPLWLHSSATYSYDEFNIKIHQNPRQTLRQLNMTFCLKENISHRYFVKNQSLFFLFWFIINNWDASWT